MNIHQVGSGITGPRAVRGRARLAAVALACMATLPAAHATADLSFLQGLLAATPDGGWVKASVGKFSDAWPTGADAVSGIYSSPGAIVRAWSSFAWDSKRGGIIIYGGGHANYTGNDVYLWNGASGNWSVGALSSRVENYVPPGADPRTWLVVDDAAPQSAHTYDGNLYLRGNDMFVTLGGGIYNTGKNFEVRGPGGELQRAGPWMWDPNLADPNKVGGTTGSGYNPLTPGGEMWTNRQGSWVGNEPKNYSNNTTAYRMEDGKDVVYLTAQAEYSGFPALYRYTVGDVRNGGVDTWERIGESYYAPSGTATAAIDSRNNLYVHTAAINGWTVDLGVWDLGNSNPNNSHANRDQAIELINTDGTAFVMTVDFGIGYDEGSGKLVLWDGRQQGTVWQTEATYDGAGQLMSTWVVKQLTSTTAEQPSGNFATGVMGKWQYVQELGAFIAMDAFNATTMDSEVWLYKPLAAIPEPSTYLLWLAGLGAGALTLRRRGRTGRGQV